MNKKQEMYKLWQASQDDDPEVLERAQFEYNKKMMRVKRQHLESCKEVEEKPTKRKRKSKKVL